MQFLTLKQRFGIGNDDIILFDAESIDTVAQDHEIYLIKTGWLRRVPHRKPACHG